MFIATLFTTAKIWKHPKCPSTDEWIKEIWHTYKIHTKLKIELPYDPANTLLSIYLDKTTIQKKKKTQNKHALLYS